VEAAGFEDSLPSSRWFTRGWTLQELIAPEFVVFVDKHFDEFGTKQSVKEWSIESVKLDSLSKLFTCS